MDEETLTAFSNGVEHILGDAIQMAISYGRIEAKHYNNISKMLNAFGVVGEYDISLVTIEMVFDELAKAINEGRLEVKDGESEIQSVQKD